MSKLTLSAICAACLYISYISSYQLRKCSHMLRAIESKENVDLVLTLYFQFYLLIILMLNFVLFAPGTSPGTTYKVKSG